MWCTVSATTTCGLSVTCVGSTPGVPVSQFGGPLSHQTFCGQHFWGPCVGGCSESNFCPNYRPFGPADWDQEVLNVNGAVVWAACPICPVSRFSRMEKSSRYFWPQAWDEEVSRDGVILSQVGPCVQMSGLASGRLHSRIAEGRDGNFESGSNRDTQELIYSIGEPCTGTQYGGF